jgi:hypothetical protein
MKYETVRRLGLALAGVQEGTSYGTPALKVNGKLFVRLRPDLDSVVMRTTFEERERLCEGDPETYYITDHYRDYPWVLVRLARVSEDAVRDLLRMAHRAAGRARTRSTKGKPDS